MSRPGRRAPVAAPAADPRALDALGRALELLRQWTREQTSPQGEREVALSFRGGHVRVTLTDGPHARARADQGATPPEATAAEEALAAARNALGRLGSGRGAPDGRPSFEVGSAKRP